MHADWSKNPANYAYFAPESGPLGGSITQRIFLCETIIYINNTRLQAYRHWRLWLVLFCVCDAIINLQQGWLQHKMSTYLPYNTVVGNAGSHPHTGPTTHADSETRAQIQTSESFVLVFVFYKVQCLQIAYLDLFKWLVVLYEYLCGQSKHRHVGISVGKRRGTRITMLPYDFSCWNGRRSGSTAMSQQDDNSPKKMLSRPGMRCTLT